MRVDVSFPSGLKSCIVDAHVERDGVEGGFELLSADAHQFVQQDPCQRGVGIPDPCDDAFCPVSGQRSVDDVQRRGDDLSVEELLLATQILSVSSHRMTSSPRAAALSSILLRSNLSSLSSTVPGATRST